MRTVTLFVFLLASVARAQVVATAGRAVVVAHDGRLELFDESQRRVWSVAGVDQPCKIVVGPDRLIVIDCFANVIRTADVLSGSGEALRTGETPIDAQFLGTQLFVLERDARALERIGADGARASLSVAADPAFLRKANGRLFVYSRLDGVVQEIAADPFRVTRSLTIAPFASDFETDGRTGYLAFPRDARLRTFDLRSMKVTGEIAAGAVPTDVAIAGARISIADPAAKRVWSIEGRQSIAAAFARGFVRGLIGLRLGGARSSEFPTGVDRVISSSIAYDSSTGTLYRIRGGKGSAIAKDVSPEGFTETSRGVVMWRNGTLRFVN